MKIQKRNVYNYTKFFDIRIYIEISVLRCHLTVVRENYMYDCVYER